MFLNEREKSGHVSRWRELRSCPADAGAGSPDPAIFSLTDALNDLEGVCTVQSCAGHIRAGTIYTAHVWLRVSRSVLQSMLQSASKVVQHDEIEELAVRYGREKTGPIIEIMFAGDERGCLARSSSIVLQYVREATGTMT